MQSTVATTLSSDTLTGSSSSFSPPSPSSSSVPTASSSSSSSSSTSTVPPSSSTIINIPSKTPSPDTHVNEEVEYDEYSNSSSRTDDEEESTLLRCCGLRPEGSSVTVHPSIACCPCGKRNGNTLTMYRSSPEARTWPKLWIVGPDWPCLCITFSLILAPSMAFFIFVASSMHIAVLVVSIFTLLVLLTALSMTAGSDPGYLKKQTPRLLEQMKANLIQQGIQQYGPEQGPLILNNYSTCVYCHQLRAPGTSHCYDCDVCVEELDHHCPWTGKCIGKYNLRYFYAFLWSLSVHMVVVIGVTFAWFITKATGLG